MDLDNGNGSDGNIIINSNKNINIDTIKPGRNYADGVSYNVTDLGTSHADLEDAALGIAVDDKVLLVNLQGTGSTWLNVGNWEMFDVLNVSGNRVTFSTNKAKYYGDAVDDDVNLGVTAANQKVVLIRVPQYNNVIINEGVTLTVNSFNGSKYGILPMCVAETLTISGTISTSNCGYRPPPYIRSPGESYNYRYLGTGFPCGTRNEGGGGGSQHYGSGGGGGYNTNGGNSSCDSGHTIYGGIAYGSETLNKIYLGSAGGRGYDAGASAYGGGIVLIIADQIDVVTGAGAIVNSGGNGSNGVHGGEGGGAGGSTLLWANIMTIGYSRAIGGSGGSGWSVGGTGSMGRIALYYNSLISANVLPTAYEEVITSYEVSGIISEPCTISVYNIDTHALIKSQQFSLQGGYTLDNIAGNSAIDVVARPVSTDKNIIGFKDIVPQES